MTRQPEPETKWEVNDRTEPRLRELVLVGGLTPDRERFFTVLLARVPCVGEDIAVKADVYRVTHVQHSSLGPDGWHPLGWHALVDVLVVPDEPRRRKAKK